MDNQTKVLEALGKYMVDNKPFNFRIESIENYGFKITDTIITDYGSKSISVRDKAYINCIERFLNIMQKEKEASNGK